MSFIPHRPAGGAGRVRSSRVAGLVAAALVAAVAATGCVARDVATLTCLSPGRTVVDVPDRPVLSYPGVTRVGDGVTLDARGSTFDMGTEKMNATKFHLDRSGHDLCLVGGSYRSSFPAEVTPFETWHKHNAVVIEEPDATLVGSRFYNVGDAVSLARAASDWRLTGIAAEPLGTSRGAYVHDDCIENDALHSGIVEDSKFDGCSVFLSSYAGGVSGAGNTVEVRHTLVRLQAYHNSYNPAKYGYNTHGGFFKWSPRVPLGGPGHPPALYVHHSVFRADQRGSYGGNKYGFLALPPDSRCHDVTLIAKGGWGPDPANPTSPAWQDRDIASWKSQCTNLRFADEREWDRMVSQWDATHPDM